jgi:hypothetical protein
VYLRHQDIHYFNEYSRRWRKGEWDLFQVNLSKPGLATLFPVLSYLFSITFIIIPRAAHEHLSSAELTTLLILHNDPSPSIDPNDLRNDFRGGKSVSPSLSS